MVNFEKVKSLRGEIEVPADKSITHRAIFFSSMAKGESVIYNPLKSEDTLATISIMQKLGINISIEEKKIIIYSHGYKSFVEPDDVLDCKNSGTTTRLLFGLLSPQKKYFVITGDDSLRKRPVDRVIIPLTTLGAKIFARMENRLLPSTIIQSQMYGGKILQTVASAQVKSAIILSGIQIDDEVIYEEKIATRNHTELLAPAYGVDLRLENDNIIVKGGKDLTKYNFTIPGDFSSAAFYVTAALIFENSSITIKNVGLNSTRTGFLNVLKMMGAKIYIDYKKSDVEPLGDISIEYTMLNGVRVAGEIIPNIIDELPLVATLGLICRGFVEVRDAKELRVKESDRIKALAYNIRALGGKFEEFEDGFIVYPLKRENYDKDIYLKSFNDHRIAMINILLAKRFGDRVFVDDIGSINVSNPEFLSILMKIEER
jgi:3-phosphoshikimate 1-carboxyvinyltransferase